MIATATAELTALLGAMTAALTLLGLIARAVVRLIRIMDGHVAHLDANTEATRTLTKRVERLEQVTQINTTATRNQH